VAQTDRFGNSKSWNLSDDEPALSTNIFIFLMYLYYFHLVAHTRQLIAY